MINYQSVASNPYGDARTKIVVYQAHIQQLPSHNEFLATGGSLYFLKYKNVIQGSDTITLQVRDQTTGLVLSSQMMTNGADYELDRGQGRILFWQPVAMIAQSNSIISNNLINGNPIYVVIDYQYAVSNLQMPAPRVPASPRPSVTMWFWEAPMFRTIPTGRITLSQGPTRPCM